MCYTHTLIEDNLVWAKKIANKTKRQLPNFVDIEDLHSAAYLGLVEAASRYKPNLRVKFTTFAYRRVLGSIFDCVRTENRSRINIISLDGLIDGGVEPRHENSDSQAQLQECLDYIGDCLGSQARMILEDYVFGNYSMKEIGQKLGLTESRISQLITSYKGKIEMGLRK